MATLTEAQVRASTAMTTAFRADQNAEAAKIAALVALYYRTRVKVDDPASVQDWLDIVIPRLISTSDRGARSAVAYFNALRRIEVPGAERFVPTPALGMVDAGVAKSLMAVGPGDYMNKARRIDGLDVPAVQKRALLADAKQVTSVKLAAAAVRHAQAGGRQTIHESSARDRVALGWVRVTRAKPCFFCAMLASRGLRYRTYSEGAFDVSDSRFTGDGDAKVHDDCACSLKPVYAEDDEFVQRTDVFADLWARWGAGGGDATLRFRRGYEHWVKTGEYLTYEQAGEGLRG